MIKLKLVHKGVIVVIAVFVFAIMILWRMLTPTLSLQKYQEALKAEITDIRARQVQEPLMNYDKVEVLPLPMVQAKIIASIDAKSDLQLVSATEQDEPAGIEVTIKGSQSSLLLWLHDFQANFGSAVLDECRLYSIEDDNENLLLSLEFIVSNVDPNA